MSSGTRLAIEESGGITGTPSSSQAVSLTLRILRCVGVWPLGKSGAYSVYTSVMCAVYPVFYLMMISSFPAGRLPTESVLEAVGVGMSFVPVTFNILTVLLKRRKLGEAVSNLRSFFNRTSHEDNGESQERMAEEEKNLIIIVPLTCMLGIFSKLVEPIVTYYSVRQDANSTITFHLPIQVYVSEEEMTVSGFASLYVFQFTVFFFLFWTFLPVEMFLCVLILYTAKQFEILVDMITTFDRRTSNRFSHAGARCLHAGSRGDRKDARASNNGEMQHTPNKAGSLLEKKSDSATGEETTQFWRKFVVLHQEALRNGASLCSILRQTLFVYYAVTSLVICLIMYQLNASDDVILIVYNCSFLGAVSIRLFVMSFLSTKLTSKSLEVNDAICATEWYGYSRDVKRMLLFITRRSQRPVRLWAGLFAVMSLETFAAIVNTGYTYFNMLNSLT